MTLGSRVGGKALWECISRPLLHPWTPSIFEWQAMIKFVEQTLKLASLVMSKCSSEDALNAQVEKKGSVNTDQDD